MKLVGTFFTAVLLASSAASAQHISVGVAGGVPLTDGLSDFTSVSGAYRTLSDSKEYIFGPMLEVRIPWNLAIEIDALYRPINVTTNLVPNLLTGPASSANVSTWEFPVLAKYRFTLPILTPFVEAGPSFRALGSELGYLSNRGLTVGGGAELKILKLRIAPELRYTHWGSDSLTAANVGSVLTIHGPSKQDQAELLVGISF
jgi:hypothetical protein